MQSVCIQLAFGKYYKGLSAKSMNETSDISGVKEKKDFQPVVGILAPYLGPLFKRFCHFGPFIQ